jgi:hypothetical protein
MMKFRKQGKGNQVFEKEWREEFSLICSCSCFTPEKTLRKEKKKKLLSFLHSLTHDQTRLDSIGIPQTGRRKECDQIRSGERYEKMRQRIVQRVLL